MDSEVHPPRFVLCLSGGGLRATFFHLGMIGALRATGALSKVTHICSVSGGSILAAHLVLNWEQYVGTPHQFKTAASKIRALARRDIRGRIVRRWLLAWMNPLLWPFFTYFQRTSLLESEYNGLYEHAALLDLARHKAAPYLNILATSFTTGNLCSFSRDGFSIEDPREPLPPRKRTIPVAQAVAASSAFPPLFPPVTLTRGSLGLTEREFSYDRERLTDGGVFDNSGFEYFFRLHNAHPTVPTTVMLSDAGADFDWKTKRRFSWIVSRTARATDILMKRVADQTFAAASGGDLSPRLVRIAVDENEKVRHDLLPVELQRPLAKIRTDLDVFSDLETTALSLHGLGCGLLTLKNMGLTVQTPLEDLGFTAWDSQDARSIARAETRLQESAGRQFLTFTARDLVSPILLFHLLFIAIAIPLLMVPTGFLLYLAGPDLLKVVWSDTVRQQILDDAGRKDFNLSILVLPDAAARLSAKDLPREFRESSVTVALGQTIRRLFLSSEGVATFDYPFYLRKSPLAVSLDSKSFVVKEENTSYSIPPGPEPSIFIEVSPKPKTLVREKIVSKKLLKITSGGTSDGHSPFCQTRTNQDCIIPQHGGKLDVGTGNLESLSFNGGPRSTFRVTVDTPDQICFQVTASTGACETEIYIQGYPSAFENYERSG